MSLKLRHVGTHMRVLSESYPMNTNMTWFLMVYKQLCLCDLDECSLSIGRVNFQVIFLSIIDIADSCQGSLFTSVGR